MMATAAAAAAVTAAAETDVSFKFKSNSGKWFFNDCKLVKIMPTSGRIAFQRKNNHYTRGLSISKDAFLNMDDVTIVPGRRIELEPNVWLSNYGNAIHLVKYCLTQDQKQCNGGFFTFTPKEWIYFWTKMVKDIKLHYEK